MKLAVSNIAWDIHDAPETVSMLREGGVTGIEVAPTKIWPDWQGADAHAAEAYRQQLGDAGFEIPALQAILFGRPDLHLFDDSSVEPMCEHITAVADLAAALGAKVLVFGSPRNRRRNSLAYNEAFEKATERFAALGAICEARSVCLGLEHNPVEYGCDFITNVCDARQLVDAVDSPGFGLHLDTGGLELCNLPDPADIVKTAPWAHLHFSAPMLEPLSESKLDLSGIVQNARSAGYEGWFSIEMKDAGAEALRSAITIATEALSK